MLSTTSGFTQDQIQRFKSMTIMLLVGIAILIFGVGILCFGRMYTFDSTKYDLFTVFGVMIVGVAGLVIIVPVYCQLRIYLEVRRDAKDNSDYGPAYAPAVHPGLATQPPLGTTLPYGGGIYQHQMQHHPPFSSATYMMGQQHMSQYQQQQPQQQQQQQPAQMMQRLDENPRQINASMASDDSVRHQGRSPIWSSIDKQQPV